MPRAMQALDPLLKDVSRSFYLTLRVLPARIRPQIGLAYLLARATDTIADTALVPVAERLAALDQLRCRVLGQTSAALDFTRFTASPVPNSGGGATPAERSLLGRIEEVLAATNGFSRADQERIREVLATITSGQELDLQRFAANDAPSNAASRPLAALQTNEELDDYTFRVAGCVGEFWTKMCRAHLFPNARLDDAALLANGVRFGKGLQLVNILRDLPADLRIGRCYVPRERLQTVGLTPEDLLAPENEPRFRALYHRLLFGAEEHLAAGWEYTNTLPWTCARVRLACAWPILIGAETVTRLRAERILDPARRIKIPRASVRRIITRTIVCYCFPGIWRWQFQRTQA